MGVVTEFVLRYEQLNPKYRVFLMGFPIAKVTYYITIMITSSLEIMCFIWYHNIAVALFDLNRESSKC